MRIHILITGTALALCASPALAGGSAGGGGTISGMSSSGHNLLGGLGHGRATRSSNATTSCLCSAAGQAVRAIGSGRPAGRMPGNASGVRLLTNSVIGLNGLGAARGVGHGSGHGGGPAIELAGIVTGNGGGVTTIGHGGYGSSLAGVTGIGAGLAGHGRGGTGVGLANVAVGNRTGAHGVSAVNVVALNRNAGMAGRVANVAVLNGRGSHGRSAINVAALNGTAGQAGRVANVAVLNGGASHGRSAVNVAALNGSGGKVGKIVNLALLNGHGAGASGFRLINGVPCLPDGTPLTGAAATAAMAAINSSRQHGPGRPGHHGGQHMRNAAHQQADPVHGNRPNQTAAPSPSATAASYRAGSSGWDRRETPNKK